MSSKDYQIVRHKVGGSNFEVLTKIGSVLKYRKGNLGWDNVLLADEIFKNASKAEKAKDSDLKTAFGTDDIIECAKIIVENGELQLTANERKEFIEKKRAEIVNYIHKYFIDPRTKTPHPVVRIEAALEELKIRIDPDTPLDKQISDIVKRMPEVMPIKKEEIEGTIKIPHKHMGAASGIITKSASIRRERYDDEACVMDITLVPGDYDSLINDLNRVTKGEYTFDIEGGAMMATSEDSEKGKQKTPASKKGGKRK